MGAVPVVRVTSTAKTAFIRALVHNANIHVDWWFRITRCDWNLCQLTQLPPSQLLPVGKVPASPSSEFEGFREDRVTR